MFVLFLRLFWSAIDFVFLLLVTGVGGGEG